MPTPTDSQAERLDALEKVMEELRSKYRAAKDFYERSRSSFGDTVKAGDDQSRLFKELTEKRDPENESQARDYDAVRASFERNQDHFEQMRQRTEDNRQRFEQFREHTAARLREIEAQLEDLTRQFHADEDDD